MEVSRRSLPADVAGLQLPTHPPQLANPLVGQARPPNATLEIDASPQVYVEVMFLGPLETPNCVK